MNLSLRYPQLTDEAEALRLHELAKADDFHFLLVAGTFEDQVATIEREARGDVPPGRVPADFYFAIVDGDIIGRISVRHALTDHLLEVGGHIGYWVAPDHRRKGYATEMLRLGLDRLRALGLDRALVTCDDSNAASAKTIERNGGILEDIRQLDHESEPKRRYWIGL